MGKSLLLILGFILFQQQDAEPIQLNWMMLQRVNTRPVTLNDIDGLLPLPIFKDPIKNYHRKIVQIDGYVIPLDKTGKTIVLSAFNMTECFFCGKAGPASVMTIKLQKPNKKYKTDQLATFRGRLLLNDTDPKELFYVLEQGYEINN